MRYDPADRSKIEIDEPALTAGRDADFAAIQERAVARGAAQAGRQLVRTRSCASSTTSTSCSGAGRNPTIASSLSRA
jgi:hypothetical protein